jgi:hypothetical protein
MILQIGKSIFEQNRLVACPKMQGRIIEKIE